MRTTLLQRSQLRFARHPGWLALCLLPAVAACDDDDDSGSLPGEIGNNHFFYVCSTIDDAHCRDGLTDFPDKLAVGGTFELTAKDEDSDTLSVRAASPVMITTDREEFRFRRAGFGAFLGFDFGDFVDFVHLEAVEVADILVVDSFGRGEETLTLSRNQRSTVTAVPLDAEGDTLAGSLVYRWASEDDTVVEIEAVGTSVQMTAVGEGTTEIRVSLGNDVFRMIPVVVRPQLSTPEDGGAGLDAGPVDAAIPDAQAPDANVTSPDAGAPRIDGGETVAVVDAGESATFDAGNSSNTNLLGADAALDGGQ